MGKSLFLSTLDEKSWTLHEILLLQILLPYLNNFDNFNNFLGLPVQLIL